MEFFNFSPSVEKVGSYYVVNGINLNAFELDLRSNFGTSVIFSRMITKLNNRRFKIHEFFMVELAWILDHFTTNKNKRQVDRYRVGMFKYNQLYNEIKAKTWIESTFQDYPPYDVDKALKNFKLTPKNDQYAFLQDYSRIKFGYQLRGCLLDAEPGSGKALSLDSKIKIPGGWTTMGEIKLGEVVTGRDGLPANVVGVYPQGEVQLYRITFADGRSVECCAEHQWTIWDRKHKTWKTADTAKIIEMIKANKDHRIHVPLITPEVTEDKSFNIDPYLLGALIGDGGMSARGVTFTNSDAFVVEKVRTKLGKEFVIRSINNGKDFEYVITNNLKEATIQSLLRELDLMGKLSKEKSIPEEYMNGSIEQRWELVRGLMDTDGSFDSMPTFNTSSMKLAQQFQELIRSLGGIAVLSARIPHYTHNDQHLAGAEAYRVHVRIGDPKRCFSLPRKQDVCPQETQYSENLKLRIESVVVSRKAEAQCITVDNEDSLYVTNDYIVTHNTFTSLVWSAMISPHKTIIVVPKHLVKTPWVDEMTNKYFKKVPKIWTSLDGTDPLNHVDADYFIIYKENLRSREFDGLVSVISKQGKEPIKIIVDESHNYNEYKSQQTQGLIDLCSNKFVSDVLFMSGTPIKAQGRETFALFTVIDKFFNKDVQDDFLKMYGRDNDFLNQMLAHRLGRIKFTITKIEGMDKPPEPIIVPVSFPGAEKYTLDNIRAVMLDFIEDRVAFYNKHMPGYISDWRDFVLQYRAWIDTDPREVELLDKYVETVEYFQKYGYNNFTDADKSKFAHSVEAKIENELKGDDLKYFRHIKSAVKYVGLKIRGEALGRVLSRARMEAVRDIIKYAKLPEMISSVQKKTAIYTSYIEVIKELENYFNAEGITPISVHGENSSDIEKVIKQVQNDPNTNPLITTFNTLREGYPLLMCNQLILMNAPFRSYELKQTIARIYRRGQDAECFVYLIDLDTGKEENITSRSIDIMEWSKEQVDILLGGGKLTMAGGASTKAIAGSMNLLSMVGMEGYSLETEHFDHRVKIKRMNVGDLF